MSTLLNKRLFRSLSRTKIRLLAVVLMIFIGVFSGITFGGYAHNLGGMYDSIQADDDNGANLADVWIDNRSTKWTDNQVQTFCNNLEMNWNSISLDIELDSCEGRTVAQGAMFHVDEDGERIINSLWHGIPQDANADRVWMPEGHSEGRIAISPDEIVIDSHVTDALGLRIGDNISISAGNNTANFSLVGIGYHPLHVLMTPEGSLFPPEPGEYVVGYLSDAGMARLTGDEIGTSNIIMIDVEGTPSFDLPDTDEYEGEEIDEIKNLIDISLEAAEIDGRVRDRGQNENVEFMRQDLKGAEETTLPFTIMIACIAAITISLSLQRLIQSQAKEIAVLRTLGVQRSSLMTGYLFAPMAIGGMGCVIGALAGPWGMDWMLDFYQGIVGMPIVEREIPFSLYFLVIGLTMIVVFLSGAFPAWKASRLEPLQVLSGQNQMRIGSENLRKITSWMPTKIGLSIRSSVRKPIRLSMTFIAVGISLMLFGSVQMMSVGLQDTFVGGLENEQTWDAQVYIMPDSENPVVEWAENYSVSYEMIIETPLGSVSDSNDVERMFTLVGLDSFTQGMRSVPIIDGKFPNADSAVPQVMMDEGSMIFLNWNVGDIRNVSINGVQIDVEIVAVSNAELARTMYFLRSDLSDIIGINATSIYLQLPSGVTVDSNLGEASVGIVERQTMLDGINDLLEQQSKAFDSMLFLGLLFTLVVMFNTMIMNIAERDFELATLRVLGASTWSIGTMLLFESILIGFIGGIVGIIFAFGGAVALASAFSSWQIFLPVSVDPGVALQIMGIVLVIAISMVPFGIWRIKRMDLVEKVKDLSQ